MNGKSAVPDPWSATTGFAISNSATPPAVLVLGLSWFAITSWVPVPKMTIVCGSVPAVVVAGSSPRYPMIPGTPVQLSLRLIIPMFDQSWLNGRDWATASARAGDDVVRNPERTTPMAATTLAVRRVTRVISFSSAQTNSGRSADRFSLDGTLPHALRAFVREGRRV